MAVKELADVPDACLSLIASFFTTEELASASTIARQWNEITSDDLLWKAAIMRDFGDGLEDTFCPASTSKARYSGISQLCRGAQVPRQFFRRANVLFAQLRRIAKREQCPELLCRLRPGAAPASLAEAATRLGRPFHAALRAVLLIHDGHDYGNGSTGVRVPGRRHDVRPTFLGYYQFYSTLVSPVLLPAAGVASTTGAKASAMTDRFLVITMNRWGAGGEIVLDNVTGEVYAMCAGMRLVPACPPANGQAGGEGSSQANGASTSGNMPGDGLLRWLECLVDRIDTGVYRLAPLVPEVAEAVEQDHRDAEEEEDEGEDEDGEDEDMGERKGKGQEQASGAGGPSSTSSPPPVPIADASAAVPPSKMRAVSLFPEVGPQAEGLASRACTRGVCVEMGCVFVPHQSYPGPGACIDARTGQPPAAGPAGKATAVHLTDPSQAKIGRYSFGYRARMYYSPSESEYPSVQLSHRHWRIEDGSGKVEQVQGAAVVGHYPLLEAVPGSKPFEYASASSSTTVTGSRMGGSFTFVPGRLESPLAEPFDAEVAHWELRVPAYIYG